MINKFICIGNLTKDPEIRKTQNDKSWATFNVAIRGSKNSNKETLFLNCKAWGAAATYIENYIRKGDTIAGVGRIEPNNYVDKQGIKHYAVVLEIDEIYKLKSPISKMQTGKVDNEAMFTGFGSASNASMDDDLPW